MTSRWVLRQLVTGFLTCALCLATNVAGATMVSSAESSALWQGSISPIGGSTSMTTTDGSLAQSASSARGSFGSASASMGVLKSFASTSAPGQSDIGYNEAWGLSQWQDTVTINSGLNQDGQAGLLHAVIALDGTLAVGGQLAAAINASVFLKADSRMVFDAFESKDTGGSYGHVVDWQGLGIAYPYGNNPDVIFGTFSFDIPFIFGDPFTLSATSYVITRTPSWTTSSATADLGNSTYWGGITGISLADGTVASNYTMESGFDWTKSMIPTQPQPVPEPSTLLLLGSGLAGLGGMAWRRHRTSRDK